MLGLTTLAGCSSEPKNKPTKVEADKPFNPSQAKPKTDEVRVADPATDPPPGRDGPQLGKPEIDTTLAAAAEHAKLGNKVDERMVLAKCANKLPASARCDGAMGLSLIQAKARRAVAHYYLIEAAKTEDPDADATLYAAVAEALRSHGLIVEATLAQEKAVARESSAAHRFALGRILSLQPDRLSEAADLIAGARAEQDSLEWLYEEAVVRGQIPTKEDAKLAAELLDAYIAKVAALPEGDPAKVETSALVGRVAELRGLESVYVTRDEYAKAKAAGALAPPPGEGTPPEDVAPTQPQVPPPATPPT